MTWVGTRSAHRHYPELRLAQTQSILRSLQIQAFLQRPRNPSSDLDSVAPLNG